MKELLVKSRGMYDKKVDNMDDERLRRTFNSSFTTFLHLHLPAVEIQSRRIRFRKV